MKNIPQLSNSIFLLNQFNLHFSHKYKLLFCVLFFIILISLPQAIFAQPYCGTHTTSPNESYNEIIQNMSETGPYYIRIYVHVIRRSNGTGGQSVEDIEFALSTLDSYFLLDKELNPINIFFVWDCEIHYVDDDVWFTGPEPVEYDYLIWDDPEGYKHSDGIDIFLFPFSAKPAKGKANGVGSSSELYVSGTWDTEFQWTTDFKLAQTYVIAHEMGHVLHLYHTHRGCDPGGTWELTDGSNCSTHGDLLCDTPADPGMDFLVDTTGCYWSWLGQNFCNPPEHLWAYDPDELNIMAYTYPKCAEYFSEEQAQRMRNAIEVLPFLQQTLVEPEPDLCTSCKITDIHIEENTTYDTDMDLIENIIVHPGAQLTVTAKLRFAEGQGIIVEPNGRLLVNGGHITNLCDGPWQGIVVIGDSDENQLPYNGNGDLYQGKVEIKNEAIIENAITGVSLFDIDNPVGTTGGIIIATGNSTFKNCGQAVHFKPYTNYYYSIGNPTFNYSYFKDCTFTVDDEILTDFHQHLYLEGVSGIGIIACDLENVKNTAYQRGNGMYAVDAHFNLEGKCTSGIPCSQWKRPTIKGFTNGIRAENSGMSFHAFRVDRTDFDNNFYSIYSSAVNNFRVTRSDFKVGLGTIFTYKPAGIYINTGTGYMVENNSFTGTLGLGNTSIGVWVRNTGNDNNKIYQNTFDGFFAANLSNGDNRNEFYEFYGLRYFCNENEDNVFDFAVPYESAGSTNGIAQNQGFYHEAAGNTFSLSFGGDESDFYNHSPWTINYFYYDGDEDQEPIDYSDFVYPIGTGFDHTCTVNYPDGPEGPQLPGKTSQFNDHSVLYAGRVAQREALIDDGDTPSLVNMINNFLSAGTQLKADLLDISPYLSYNALVAAADRYDILSHADVYDIMVANPDESRQEPLLEYLETKTNPMPSNMVDSLRNQPFTVTARTILENQIAYHAVEKESAANFILHHYLTDTTGLQMDSILFWLNNKGGLTSEYVKVDVFLHDRDTTAAIQQLDSIAQNYTLSADQTTELGYFSDLKHLQVNLLRGGRTILECDSAEVEELVEIAGSSRWLAGQQAQNILNFAYGHDSIPAPILPELSGGVRLADQRVKTNAPSVIYAFPNPADNLVTFQYSLPEADARCFIQVFDRYGRKVITLPAPKKQGFVDWNTNDVREGLYFYSMTNGKKVIESGKVVIAH